MKQGDKIRLQLHGHNEIVDATVTAIVDADHVRATIDDPQHPLCMVDGKKREITCSTNMFDLFREPEKQSS